VSSRLRRRAAAQRRVEARDAKADREAAIADRDRLATALQRERAAHGSDLERDRDAIAANRAAEPVPGATTPVADRAVVERPVVYNSDTHTYETAGATPGSIDMTDPQDVDEPVASSTGRRKHGLVR
jgi:hypothetical protein